MTEGYWTILLFIMLLILLLTGWKAWLAQHFSIMFISLSYVSIWISVLLHWVIPLNVNSIELTIDGSIILIVIMQLAFLLKGLPQKSQMLYSMMYILLMAFLATISHAIIIYSPWVKANIAYWYIPVCSGLLLGVLGVSFKQLGVIVFWGAIVADTLLLWQQKGEYIARIGTLLWWDLISMTIICSFIFILVLEIIVKIGRNFMNGRLNRTKS
ncbi:MAG TPA: hypothetical protein IAA29_10065 [Candidatus Paenibacillus intestinavium]|nr:hypothetical protein [Candidatus Paenibacillus intestinavium]